MGTATRTVLMLAEEEARTLNHQFVGTGHILLGLIREAHDDAARILAPRADAYCVCAKVEEIVGAGPNGTDEKLPFSPGAAKVLQFAQREAKMYDHQQLKPVHLLLGILREGEGTAMQTLLRLDVDISAVRAEASGSLESSG